MKRLTTALLVGACALALAACGGSSKKSPSTAQGTPAAAATVKISTRTLPSLGAVLVNADGDTLYIFAPDKDKSVTCVAACAGDLPPATLASGARPLASGAVKQSLLGSDADPTGGRVITYAGWPLYTYDGDSGPGDDTGQAINQNGGLWYVISAAGKVVKTAR